MTEKIAVQKGSGVRCLASIMAAGVEAALHPRRLAPMSIALNPPHSRRPGISPLAGERNVTQKPRLIEYHMLHRPMGDAGRGEYKGWERRFRARDARESARRLWSLATQWVVASSRSTGGVQQGFARYSMRVEKEER
jgi:hypothetical protein